MPKPSDEGSTASRSSVKLHWGNVPLQSIFPFRKMPLPIISPPKGPVASFMEISFFVLTSARRRTASSK